MKRRLDRSGLIEYVCKCGVGHPVWGSALWICQNKNGTDYPELDRDATNEMIHGCCGCCERDDWPGTVENSLKVAHDIIKSQNKTISQLNREISRLLIVEQKSKLKPK